MPNQLTLVALQTRLHALRKTNRDKACSPPGQPRKPQLLALNLPAHRTGSTIFSESGRCEGARRKELDHYPAYQQRQDNPKMFPLTRFEHVTFSVYNSIIDSGGNFELVTVGMWNGN